MRLILLAILLSAPCPAPLFAQAIWGGQQYNHAICSSPNCAMCASIRAQLNSQYSPVVRQPQYQLFAPPQSMQPKQASEYATITIETLPGCAPCARWKANEAQELRAAGWKVIETPLTSSSSAPFFRICIGGECFSHSGYMSHEALRRILASRKKPVQTQVRKATHATTQPAKVDMMTNTELVPTPTIAVEAMLAVLRLAKTDVLYDIGCGDGRFIVTAAKEYGCTSVGIELNHQSAEMARQRAADALVTSKVMIFESDAQNLTYLGADVVVMYLYPELMDVIVPKLNPGCRIASYIHEIPGVESTKYTVADYVFYVGTKK